MPQVRLDAVDAAELAEMLQFLSQWLVRDPARLGPSLEEFVGNPAYGLQDLQDDLERFVFLLGGSDGEPLFGLTVMNLPGSPAGQRYAGGALPASTSFALALRAPR